MMQFTRDQSENRVAELKVTGNLDAVTAPRLSDTVEALARGTCSEVVVDLSELVLIDSSGVAVLVSLYKQLRARGAQMRIVGAHDQPLAILQLLKLDHVFALGDL